MSSPWALSCFLEGKMTLLIDTPAIRNHAQLIENKGQPRILIATFHPFFPPLLVSISIPPCRNAILAGDPQSPRLIGASAIRNPCKPLRISHFRFSNRHKMRPLHPGRFRGTRLRLPLRPASKTLIGSPVIRIPLKARRVSRLSFSNRRLFTLTQPLPMPLLYSASASGAASALGAA
jgi:hypothetical protein